MNRTHHAATPRPQPPWLITLASSAGGITALQGVLSGLPRDLPAAVVIVQHRTPASAPNHLSRILARSCALPVLSASDDQAIEPGHVYLARSDLHLTVSRDRRFSYTDGRRIRFLRSSANPLLESAARVFTDRLVAVVLTGTGSDATDGVQTVKAHGGVVIAQDPASAQYSGMPESAVRSGAVDLVLPLQAIGPVLYAIVRGRPMSEVVPQA